MTIFEFVRRELPASLQARSSVIYLGVDHYPDEAERESAAHGNCGESAASATTRRSRSTWAG